MAMTSQPGWNRRLAFAAWSIYVVSFFLPSYDTLRGYQCATCQTMFWDQAVHGDWTGINYELITLSNLTMLLSPWLLFSFAKTSGRLKAVRMAVLLSTLLVWLFVGRILASSGDRQAIRIGCLLWTLSFGVLSWATRPICKSCDKNSAPVDQPSHA